MADRVFVSSCERVACLFFGESFDDYAAAVVLARDDGSAHVSIATGRDTWRSLLNACSGNRAIATRLSDMRCAELWTNQTVIGGFIQSRAISDADGEIVAYLFKR